MRNNIVALTLFILLGAQYGCDRSDTIQREEEMPENVQSTADVVKQGTKCSKLQETGDLKCDYKIGDDLEFTIWGVGYPNASIVVGKSNGEDGEYDLRFSPDKFCITIMAGEKIHNKVVAQSPEATIKFLFEDSHAHVSPATGKAFSNYLECEVVTSEYFQIEFI